MTDASQIAKALTPAQRKALLAISEVKGSGMAEAKRDWFNANAANSLAFKRLVKREVWKNSETTYTATDLGRSVAAELKG